MKKDTRKHNFIVQGSILAIAGILCRIIGMLYRLPLVDIIGTKGNGYYTSAYSIYNILLIISSYSLPTAISRIISERLSKDRPSDARRALKVAFVYSTVIGALMFSLMYFGSGLLAGFVRKPFLKYVLMTLAPTVWIMAYLGLLRGYFQGTGNMMPTAVSQILEQVINAVVSLVMARLLFDYGLRANLLYGEEEYSYAFGAAGGTIGTGAGALIALLFFIIIYFLYGKDYTEEEMPEERGRRKSRRSQESYGTLTVVLFSTLIPILLSSFVYNVNIVLDDFIFSRLMDYFALGAEVVLLWGIFGEFRVIYNIPVAIANSLSSSLIPSLTRAVVEKDQKLVIHKISLSIRFIMLISIPAAVGMTVLADPICRFLFPSETTGTLSRVLAVGSSAVVFYSLSTITNGILQGMGHYNEPLINALLGLIFHVLALVGLLFLKPGIMAVIVSFILMGVIVCILNNISIKKHVRLRINYVKTYLIPLLLSLVMGAAAFVSYRLIAGIVPESVMKGRWATGAVLCVSIGIALVIYLVLLFLVHPFTPEELVEMPAGRKIYALAKKCHLM